MNPNRTTAETLPDTSRVWIYQSGRSLTPQEIEEMTELGQTFVKDWASHGRNLSASFDIRYERFVILTVDELAAGASGCSIDTSVHFMQGLELQFDTTFFDRMTLCYIDKGELEVCKMSEISNLIDSGLLTKDTIVFNNTVQTKLELGNRWKVRLEDSWVGQYL